MKMYETIQQFHYFNIIHYYIYYYTIVHGIAIISYNDVRMLAGAVGSDDFPL